MAIASGLSSMTLLHVTRSALAVDPVDSLQRVLSLNRLHLPDSLLCSSLL